MEIHRGNGIEAYKQRRTSLEGSVDATSELQCHARSRLDREDQHLIACAPRICRSWYGPYQSHGSTHCLIGRQKTECNEPPGHTVSMDTSCCSPTPLSSYMSVCKHQCKVSVFLFTYPFEKMLFTPQSRRLVHPSP